MFKKIRRALTGYKVKYVSINGLKIKVLYKGEMPSSDPLSALKELKVKLDQTPNSVPITLDFCKYWEERIGYSKGVSPSSIAKFQIENRQYKISRFVTKQNKSPLSLYTFSVNDEVFALFSRVYDYGDFFKEVENELITNFNFKKHETDMNIYHITNEKYSLVIDVFGHSQSFLWNDKVELDKCLGSII